MGLTECGIAGFRLLCMLGSVYFLPVIVGLYFAEKRNFSHCCDIRFSQLDNCLQERRVGSAPLSRPLNIPNGR